MLFRKHSLIPNRPSGGDVKATIITGVVIQEGYADDMTVPRIEVLMAEPEATVRQKLLISGEVHDLKMDHNRKLEIACEILLRSF